MEKFVIAGLKTEYYVRGKYIYPHERAEEHRRIGARNKKVYGAVIEHLKYLFRETLAQTVIYARYGVEGYHRSAENYTAEKCCKASL